LDETAVDAFVANNGYLTAEVDGSVTNELELPDQSGHNGEYLTTDGSSVSWASVSGSGSTPVYGFANITTAGSQTTSETNFGAHTSAVVSTTVSASGITWDGTNYEFDVTTTGVYEIVVMGTLDFDANSDGVVRIYVGGSEQNSVSVLNIFTSAGNPFSVNWIGSVTSGTSIDVTLESTANITFDAGSTISIKKID
jgi:hypothetical protein